MFGKSGWHVRGFDFENSRCARHFGVLYLVNFTSEPAVSPTFQLGGTLHPFIMQTAAFHATFSIHALIRGANDNDSRPTRLALTGVGTGPVCLTPYHAANPHGCYS